MKLRFPLAVVAALAVASTVSIAADWPISEKLDLDAIYRIKEEGLQHSKVMEL